MPTAKLQEQAKKQAKKAIRQFKQWFFIFIGAVICGATINIFFVPYKFLSGGFTGIAMILYFLFGSSIGLVNIVFNIPLFIIAYKLLSREYFINGLFGMLTVSLSIQFTSFLSKYPILQHEDIMLAAIYGGVFYGIGAGIIFRANGNAGGTDIIGLVLKKYKNLDVGFVGFSINCFIMVVAAFLFDVKLALYTLLCMFVSGKITDIVIDGFNKKRTAFIISEHSNEIAYQIMEEISRGVTILNGEGAFTGDQKRILMVVISMTQIAKLKMLVFDIDPHAFMTILDASEVQGHGFSKVSIPKSVEN